MGIWPRRSVTCTSGSPKVAKVVNVYPNFFLMIKSQFKKQDFWGIFWCLGEKFPLSLIFLKFTLFLVGITSEGSTTFRLAWLLLFTGQVCQTPPEDDLISPPYTHELSDVQPSTNLILLCLLDTEKTVRTFFKTAVRGRSSWNFGKFSQYFFLIWLISNSFEILFS